MNSNTGRSGLPLPQLSLTNPQLLLSSSRMSDERNEYNMNPPINYNEIAVVSPSTNYPEKTPSPYSEKHASPVEHNPLKSQILSDFGEFDTVAEHANEGRPNQYSNQNQNIYENEQGVTEYHEGTMSSVGHSGGQRDNLHLNGK
jgi:hypothetical protein